MPAPVSVQCGLLVPILFSDAAESIRRRLTWTGARVPAGFSMTCRERAGLWITAPAPVRPSRCVDWSIRYTVSYSMNAGQFSLFEQGSSLPQGCRYERDLIRADEERELVARLADLPFRAFEFQGYLGKRRVVSFGWQYDFNTRELRKAEDIPPFLLPLREKATAFAGLASALLQHVLVTEYAPGAAIGWHKEKAVFRRGGGHLPPVLLRVSAAAQSRP